MPDWAYGAAVSGDWVCLPIGEGGLQIASIQCTTGSGIDLDPEQAPAAELTCATNPIVSSGAIHLTLPRAGGVRLAVHDAAGRRVRLLLDANLPAGEHRLTWDGRDGSGRRVPAGLYYLALQGSPGSRSRSVMVVR